MSENISVRNKLKQLLQVEPHVYLQSELADIFFVSRERVSQIVREEHLRGLIKKKSGPPAGFCLSGEFHPNWKGGIQNEPYPFGFDEVLKERIRARDGYRCRLCGIPQSTCTRRLSVHHVDYNKRNLDPTNLISLCDRDNARVNFNRDHWIRFFRELLKEC